VLEHHADPRPHPIGVSAGVRDVLGGAVGAVQHDPPVVDLLEQVDGLEQRRLA
jgi:hypothetical protein